MRIRHLLMLTPFLCAAALAQNAPLKSAHANLADGQGKAIGTATFSAVKNDGVRIKLNVSGLKPGVHALHIHTVGQCQGPAFTSAGGHLNPDMKMHGKDNPMGAHAGDLLNFTVDAKGKSKATVMADHVTLGTAPNGLFHTGGTALVIHANPDDYKTDPTGNAGDRIACGVIMQ
jgi:Cu-Zn family superoxide dismutase